MTADYAARCAEATTDQGLDPAYEVLRDARLPVVVEQTGGFCMAVAVYGEAAYVWTTASEVDDDRFLVCWYDANDECGQEGVVLSESATAAELPDLVRSALAG